MYDLSKEKQDYTQLFYELLLSVMTSSGGNLDMSAPRMTLIGSVKLKIDELQPQTEGVQFIDTGRVSNVLDMYINGLLDESAKEVLQLAPIHVIKPVDGDAATVVPNGVSGHVILEDDYIRFVALKMNTWLQEVTTPITTRDRKYKLQKYATTMGKKTKPVVVLNTSKINNGSAVAQVDTLTLTGSSGSANIACAGKLMTIDFDTSLTDSATAFVANYAALMLAEGVVLTSSGEDLIFTAETAGTPFTSPWISNTDGDLAGTVVNTTPNVPLYETVRVLEYYSIAAGEDHTIDKFQYVGNTGAEFIQDDLRTSVEWMCASKVLQIMGNLTSQQGAAEKALANVELSFKNLL